MKGIAAENNIDESFSPTILLVEDNDGFRRLIRKRLNRENFSVEVAGSGREAVNRVLENPEQILLLDYKLPDMTGRQLIENLEGHGCRVPFVVITGHGDERLAVEMMKLGARDYLVKDHSLLEVLPQVIEQVAGHVAVERKLSHMSKALEASEERFKVLFNSGSDAIFVQGIVEGKPGRLVEVNDVACRRLGYSREELLQKSLEDIEQFEDENMDADTLFERQRLSRKQLLYEAVHLTRNGRRISVENNSHFINLNGNSVIICMSRDITRRKQLEEQLHQALKMEAIGKLAGGVAHDFNNLLTAIMGYSELILGKMDNQSPYRPGIMEIKKAGERAASLTQQLLAFSRKQILKPSVLSLNSVVNGMERMLERIIGENIKLVSQLDPELDNIKADAGKLEQIILNLSVNAVEAMPEGGRLEIRTDNTTRPGAEPERFVRLSVSDSGKGMKSRLLPQIFEPFFTTKDSGTGLGLSVVYGIVKQHNGWIDVDSKPGGGSSFRVYFPSFGGIAVQKEEETSSLLDFEGRGERILLIEDEAGVRQVSAKALRDYGYEVLEAVDVRSARQLFEDEKGDFRLVVSDIILPDGNGIDLVDALCRSHPTMKVLLTSGYADQRVRRSYVEEKGIPFLPKPYSPVELLRTVSGVLA